MKKTKADLFQWLNTLNGKLPDGEKLGRGKFIDYCLKHFDVVDFRGQPTGRGSLYNWYIQWYRGETPREQAEPIRAKQVITNSDKIASVHESRTFTKREQIDPRINFLDDSDFDFNLDEGETEYLPPYVWPIEGKVLFMQDTHFPFHNLKAIQRAVKDGLEQKVDGILLNGDILDFYGCSFHDKQLDKKRIVDEVHLARNFFQLLRRAFPDAHIVFHEGNHETRLERYIIRNAPALQGLEGVALDQLLHLADYNIHYVKNRQAIQMGKLAVIHGNEFNTGGGGVHVARQIRLKALCNVAFGNFHRTQEDTGKDMFGNIHTAFSMGCLCDLSPNYMQYNGWNLGYAIVEIMKDGTFQMQNKKIINGVVY